MSLVLDGVPSLDSDDPQEVQPRGRNDASPEAGCGMDSPQGTDYGLASQVAPGSHADPAACRIARHRLGPPGTAPRRSRERSVVAAMANRSRSGRFATLQGDLNPFDELLRPRTLPRHNRLSQRLREVVPEVVGFFQADREPDQARGDPLPRPLLGGLVAVAGGGGMAEGGRH